MQSFLHLSIPSPCHESWQQMTPREQGRFCASCQKTVIDFSTMSDREILDHLSRAGFNTCGRFAGTQLNRELVMPAYKRHFSLAYVWKLLIPAFLLSSRSYAQVQVTRLVKGTISKVQRNEKHVAGKLVSQVVAEKEITGVVIDAASGEPVSYASVQAGHRSAIADSGGRFTVKSNSDSIIIYAIGYASQQFSIDVDSTADKTFTLARTLKMLPPVIVNGNELTGIAGAVSVVRVCRYTTSEKLKRKWDNWKPGKEVKIFPNPASSGQSITVAFRLKDHGEYRMELMDAAGRVVNEQAVFINSDEQQLTIPVQGVWAKGMYWVRVSGKPSKKAFHAKLIIQ